MAQQNEQFGNSEQLAQQTAVDWLIEQLAKTDPRNLGEILTIHQQAKEMFKQQIIKAHMAGDNFPVNTELYKKNSKADADQYYNQTYGK